MNCKRLHVQELIACVLLCAISRLGAVRRSGACAVKVAVETCQRNQFTCFNGNCIDRRFHCNGRDNCGDNSDEQYCNNNHFFHSTCPQDKHLKQCSNGKCIPKEWICDGNTDCSSGEDETSCGEVLAPGRRVSEYKIAEARRNAIKWLHSYSSSDIGIEKWGHLASKATVALYLAETEQSMDDFLENGKTSMRNMADELSIQLLTRLAHKPLRNIHSTDLSSFVNALLVTCRDPRQFYGFDLIAELRLKVDSQNFTNPYDLLTLCNAGETITTSDENKLTEVFQNNYREFWTDMQSLAVMALVCAGNQPGNSIDSELLKELTMELKNHQYRNGTVESLQTTALVMQALYAAEPDEDPDNFDEERALEQILHSQKSDGSFGSLMKTYYVLPVLNCRSLVNVSSKHCQVKQKDGLNMLPRTANHL